MRADKSGDRLLAPVPPLRESASGFTGALVSGYRRPGGEAWRVAAKGKRCFKHTHSPANAGLARLRTGHPEPSVFGLPRSREEPEEAHTG